MRSRPQSVTIAAILLALLSVANLLSPVMPSEGVPAFVIYLGVVLGVLGVLLALPIAAALPVGPVAHHRRLRDQHPLSGSWVGLRADPHAASPCDNRGCGFRGGYLVGGAAELAASVHLTTFCERRFQDVE